MPLPPPQVICPTCKTKKARRHCDDAGCRYVICPDRHAALLTPQVVKGIIGSQLRWVVLNRWVLIAEEGEAGGKGGQPT